MFNHVGGEWRWKGGIVCCVGMCHCKCTLNCCRSLGEKIEKKSVCCWHFFKRIGGFCAVRFNEDRIQYEYRYHIHYFMNIPLYTSYFAIDFFNKVWMVFAFNSGHTFRCPLLCSNFQSFTWQILYVCKKIEKKSCISTWRLFMGLYI